MTSYADAFSRPIKKSANQVISEYEKTKNNFAGINERPASDQKMQMTSVLTGEKFKNRKIQKKNFICKLFN